MEETLRYTTIVPTLIRESLMDTEILGHNIPKGTMVFFFINTASFLQPAFDINEERRTKSSRLAKDLYGVWNNANMGEFVPERWLTMEEVEEKGQIIEREVFDPHAGPQLAFGAGPRSCFGRKLAYVELRIAFTLLIWTFEFLLIDEKLNDFEAEESFTLLPRNCYVKLKKIEY
jgi:cytochrome P450